MFIPAQGGVGSCSAIGWRVCQDVVPGIYWRLVVSTIVAVFATKPEFPDGSGSQFQTNLGCPYFSFSSIAWKSATTFSAIRKEVLILSGATYRYQTGEPGLAGEIVATAQGYQVMLVAWSKSQLSIGGQGCPDWQCGIANKRILPGQSVILVIKQ